MKLNNGSLYWPATSSMPPIGTRLERNVRADVLVIGAGVTGALAANALSGLGARVVIVDKRAPISGSTPASTALLMYEIDTPLVDLSKAIGSERATRAYLASYEALTAWPSLAGSDHAACELVARPSLYLATTESDLCTLDRETDARQNARLPVEFLTRSELCDRFGLDRPGAILSNAGFEINPVRAARLLLDRSLERGAALHPSTEVDIADIGAWKPPYAVGTTAGPVITADWIVIATGYQAPEQFQEVASLTNLKTTFALATDPVVPEPWKHRAMIWEAASPYLYARRTADGRVLIGGEDEDFSQAMSREPPLASKCHVLMDKLRRLSPGIDTSPAYCWAGTFGESVDGLPFIGVHPRWNNILFALGYGGNGITFGLLASSMIRDIVAGRKPENADLFSVCRPLPTGSH